jgi:hypothetical protein
MGYSNLYLSLVKWLDSRDSHTHSLHKYANVAKLGSISFFSYSIFTYLAGIDKMRFTMHLWHLIFAIVRISF